MRYKATQNFLVSWILLLVNLTAEPATRLPYGEGEHIPYNDEVWSGREEVVTKLKKGDTTYTLVRTSRYLFEVRSQKEKSETLFKLDLLAEGTRLAPFGTKLVDVYRKDNAVSALLYAQPGYYFVSASRSKPVLGKGRFMLWPKSHQVEGWHLTANVWGVDFFSNDNAVDFTPDSKVGSINLVDLNRIECASIDDKKQLSRKYSYLIEGDKLVQEGVVIHQIPSVSIKNEEDLVKRWSEIQDAQLVAIILRVADSKDEFLKMILENNRDRRNYDALKARLDKAFASVETDGLRK